MRNLRREGEDLRCKVDGLTKERDAVAYGQVGKAVEARCAALTSEMDSVREKDEALEADCERLRAERAAGAGKERRLEARVSELQGCLTAALGREAARAEEDDRLSRGLRYVC